MNIDIQFAEWQGYEHLLFHLSLEGRLHDYSLASLFAVD